jgi:hypothetical protein
VTDCICCDYQHTSQRVYQILGFIAFAVLGKCKQEKETEIAIGETVN